MELAANGPCWPALMRSANRRGPPHGTNQPGRGIAEGKGGQLVELAPDRPFLYIGIKALTPDYLAPSGILQVGKRVANKVESDREPGLMLCTPALPGGDAAQRV